MCVCDLFVCSEFAIRSGVFDVWCVCGACIGSECVVCACVCSDCLSMLQ